MPVPSRITPALIAEVSRRRVAGEAWKSIAADFRRRRLPTDRATWLRAGALVMSPDQSSRWRDVAQRFGP